MKKIIFIGAFFLCVLLTWAAPLRNVPVTLVQPNGDTLRCFASGDEYFNYKHDANDYVIIQDKTTGYYVYAIKAGDDIAPSAFVPGKDNPQTVGLVPHTLPSPEKIAAIITAARKAMELPLQQDKQFQQSIRNAAVASGRNRGTMNNIVIFIRFADDPEFTAGTYTALKDFCNATTGISMKTYYQEASYGLFTPESYFYPTSVGTTYSYKDANNRSYYEISSYKTDTERIKREQTLLKNAIEAVKSQIPANLNLDMNGDGYVDNIIFMVKGTVDSSPNPWGTLLWPHQWAFIAPNYTTTINGKITGTFNFQLEADLMDPTSGGASTLCHELFHTLGAPDLYHYTYRTDLHPVYTWDLMESNTTPPQHMSAYMKHKYGNWIDDIPFIGANGVYALAPLNSSTDNKVCYRIESPVSTGVDAEYYVVEYRKRAATGIESAIPNSGLLIYRINPKFKGNEDYNGTTIFDEVYLYRPNGTTTAEGKPQQANFSASVNRTAFNNTTNPKCFLSDGMMDDIYVFDVSAPGDSIYFTMGGMADSIVINTSEIQMGIPQTLSAALFPQTAGGIVVWTVKDTMMAKLTADDMILGKEAGTVTVRAEVLNNAKVFAEKIITINPTAISIDNDVIQEGVTAQLTATMAPSTLSPALVWSVKNVTGSAQVKDSKIIGQSAGFVNVHVQLEDCDCVYAEKKVIITGSPDEDPVIDYWENKGADGLLTIESPSGISLVECFSNGGKKVQELDFGGATTIQYLFASYPHGVYFLKVWNAEKTKSSNLKILW